ncbi:sodium-dependent lysophosphatidylcholine symporter 1 [Melanotaenia boesemani]|uniref:sodium-dependent lysophosphatidylcholine symporter 1 n=1 Tax=Melanotaenia boesemani TaxID=1250792 RepID=UPI001C04779D|nr:sodium-dependent lysophosphatidylcholine symporter 1 [Melanotaenia boesemani]
MTRSGGIPLARKVCYAVGGVPYQMTTAAINISLQIFLLDVVQMEASYVSMILFVSRAWDAVTDPVVGYLVSRSSWTPIGKLTPWPLFSSPFCILLYVLLWFVPTGLMPEAAYVLWFLVATCLFETLMSCYNVPYLSLSMFLGGHQRDRDSTTAYRMSVEMVAMLLASVIQGQVVSVYNTEKQEACEQLDQVYQTPQSTSAPQTASLQETQKAFLTSALVMAALFFLCSLVLFFGVREQQVPLSSDEKIRPSCRSSIKMLMCHVPYQRLVLGFVFSVLAFQMSLGNFALFCSHAAGLGAQFQLLLLVLLVSASIAVPFWQIVLLKIGKKNTVFIGLSLFIPAVLVVACVPSNLPVFMTMCILMGFSVATMFLLPWSMLPDVIDDFAVKHSSCKDLEPLFFSGYAFCSKLAGGLSAGLSTMTLQIVGYKASACNHGDGVVTALIVLFSPVPITLLLTGMVFFFTYPINERQGLELQDHQLHPESTSSSPSSPSPDSKDHTKLQTISQKPCVGATSTSHPNTETKTLYKSGFSPCWYHVGTKLSTCSNVSNSPFGKSTRSTSHVPFHKQILETKKHKGDDELVGSFPGSNPDSFSSRSYVKSKVTWV